MNKKGMYIFLTLIVLMIFDSPFAMAEEAYLSEVSTAYSVGKYDHNYDGYSYGAGASLYFSPVNTEGHPLAEAAFIERAGSINIGGMKYFSDYKTGTVEYDGEGRIIYTSLSLQKPKFPLAFYLSASIGESEGDYKKPGPYFSEGKGQSYSLGIGWFLKDGLAIAIDYNKGDSDYKGNYGGTFRKTSSESKGCGISGKYVQKLASEFAFSLYAAYSKDEDKDDKGTENNETYSLSGSFYLNHKVSISAGFSKVKGDTEYAEGETKSIGLDIFATNGIAFLIYHSIDDPKQGNSYKSKYTTGSLRFRF